MRRNRCAGSAKRRFAEDIFYDGCGNTPGCLGRFPQPGKYSPAMHPVGADLRVRPSPSTTAPMGMHPTTRQTLPVIHPVGAGLRARPSPAALASATDGTRRGRRPRRPVPRDLQGRGGASPRPPRYNRSACSSTFVKSSRNKTRSPSGSVSRSRAPQAACSSCASRASGSPASVILR